MKERDWVDDWNPDKEDRQKEDGENGKGISCAECRRKLEQGMDVLGLQEGVVGPRGLVPLEEWLFFCSEDCLGEFFSGGEPEAKLKRRVP